LSIGAAYDGGKKYSSHDAAEAFSCFCASTLVCCSSALSSRWLFSVITALACWNWPYQMDASYGWDSAIFEITNVYIPEVVNTQVSPYTPVINTFERKYRQYNEKGFLKIKMKKF
jgi:hypothetical protein